MDSPTQWRAVSPALSNAGWTADHCSSKGWISLGNLTHTSTLPCHNDSFLICFIPQNSDLCLCLGHRLLINFVLEAQKSRWSCFPDRSTWPDKWSRWWPVVDIYFIAHEILRERNESTVREARNLLDNNVIAFWRSMFETHLRLRWAFWCRSL